MPPPVSDPFILDCRGRALDCRAGRVHVMGILNVTPDSFSDGGDFLAPDAALRRAEAILEEGAVLIDIGGESSRPRGSVYGDGAEPVGAEEELQRVLPVVEALAARLPEALLSVDTYKPEVAGAALDAGAHLINDITGLRYGDGTARAAAQAGAPLIVMHSLGRPGAMPHNHTYSDVVLEVMESLTASVRTAEAAGVRDVVVDPGFGFGKSVAENLRLIGRGDALLDIGRPVLVGLSRKSTVGAVLGTVEKPAPVSERLFGALGMTAAAVLAGASIVRTHDVRATMEMLQGLTAVTEAANSGALREVTS